MINFKFNDVTAWLKKFVIHILPNISRSKGNQTMKFGQLIECYVRKSSTKCGEETSLRRPNVYTDWFCCMPS